MESIVTKEIELAKFVDEEKRVEFLELLVAYGKECYIGGIEEASSIIEEEGK